MQALICAGYRLPPRLIRINCEASLPAHRLVLRAMSTSATAKVVDGTVVAK